jgi:hypothetical protein
MYTLIGKMAMLTRQDNLQATGGGCMHGLLPLSDSEEAIM